MPQDNIQNSPKPDEAAAVLSFATNLSQQHMPKRPAMEGADPTSNQKPADDIDAKLNEFKDEVKGMIEGSLSSIKDSIQKALKDDGK